MTDVVALHGGQTQNVSVQVCEWSWFPRGRLRATRAAPREHRQPSQTTAPKDKVTRQNDEIRGGSATVLRPQKKLSQRGSHYGSAAATACGASGGVRCTSVVWRLLGHGQHDGHDDRFAQPAHVAVGIDVRHTPSHSHTSHALRVPHARQQGRASLASCALWLLANPSAECSFAGKCNESVVVNVVSPKSCAAMHHFSSADV